MLGLPAATEIKKPVPKAELIRKLSLRPADQRLLNNTVSRIELVNQISPQTVPALCAGSEVQSIFILKITLKQTPYDRHILSLLFRVIPQKLILILCCGGKVQLAVWHDKPLVSEWSDENTVTLSLQNTNLDTVWLSLKCQISGVRINENLPLTSDSLTRALKRQEEKNLLEQKINRLEKQCCDEVQPKRKFALHQEICQLKAQLQQMEFPNG